MSTIEPGLGFSVLGDSISTLGGHIPAGWRVHYEGDVHVNGITAPQHTWWGQVIDHFGGHLVGNASFSGSCVEGFGFPAGWTSQRLDALLGAHGQQPDVVLVFMGINDYGWGGARNQVMGRSKSASARPEDLPLPHAVQETVDEAALEQFQRAYQLMLEGVVERAPQARIWCMNLAPGTPPAPNQQFTYQIRGIELAAYNKAIAHAAESVHARVIDLCGLGFCYDATDGVHPSAAGMKQLAHVVMNALQGKASSQADPVLANAAHQQRFCTKNTCEGCAFAPTTPTGWLLHCNGPLG